MSNREVSSLMKYDRSDLPHIIVSIRKMGLYLSWHKETFNDTPAGDEITQIACEVVLMASDIEAKWKDIEQKLDQYAGLIESIDLLAGNDSGIDGVLKAYKDLQDRVRSDQCAVN